MAATSWNPKQPRLMPKNGSIPEIFMFPEAAAQSYKAGALVYLDATNGRVTACADGATLITGIAMKDATTVTSADAPVQIIQPGDLLYITCYDESDGAEVAANTLKAGFTYDLEVDANGVCYAEYDTEHATTEELIFVQPVYDANGDSTNVGIFQVETTALTFGDSD